MPTSRTHMTALPKGFITVRILQSLFTIAILALTIFTLATDGNVPEFIVLLSAAVTTIILVWMISATYLFPKAYNYWAILTFEIFSFLLWIDGFIWALGNSFSTYGYDNCYDQYNAATNSYDYTCDSMSAAERAVSGALPAIAAFSGCNMVLFLVSMIVVSVFIARHRDGGGHNKLGSAAPVFRGTGAPLMAQTDYELRSQNLALQQQFLALQQQHLELQRKVTGLPVPPMAAGQAGREDVARGNMDLESGLMRGHEQSDMPHTAYSSRWPIQPTSLIASPMEGVAGPSQQPEMVQSHKGKEREMEQAPVMSGAHGDGTREHDEMTEAPVVR